MKFITEDDIWGIRRAVYTLWGETIRNSTDYFGLSSSYRQFAFDAFYNQQIPEAWRETLATVKRHTDDIKKMVSHSFNLIWYRRNGQINSADLNRCNQQFIQAINNKEIELPTYMEIEEEKQKWQAHPQYNKERGFSQPIREEMIQLKIHKGGE